MADTESTATSTEEVAPISLVIVDDDALTLAAMAALCRRIPGVTLLGTAHTGTAGVALIRDRTPAIALLDISLHDLDGITIARRLREKPCPTRVVLIADHPDVRWSRMALSVPVPGYLLRSSDPDEFSLAIRSVATGGVYYATVMQQHLSPDSAAGTATQLDLTGEERHILRLLMNGMTAKQIAHELSIEIRRVFRVTANLRKKCGVDSNAALVAYAIEHDLLLMGHGAQERPEPVQPTPEPHGSGKRKAKAKGSAQTGG
jgi:DNA-binding NarL/FixJ family response regulator